MDLSASDYMETVNRGALLQLRHPGTGKRFSEHGGQDLHAHVLGIDADVVVEAKREASRVLMRSAKGTSEVDTVQQLEIEVACACVVAFRGGTGSVTTLDQFKSFLKNHPDGKLFARQILMFAEKTSGFFSVPPTS